MSFVTEAEHSEIPTDAPPPINGKTKTRETKLAPKFFLAPCFHGQVGGLHKTSIPKQTRLSHLKPTHMTPSFGRVAHSLFRLPMSRTRCIARYQTLDFLSTTGLTARRKRRITDCEISGRNSRTVSHSLTHRCGGGKSGSKPRSLSSKVARSGKGMRKAVERFRRLQPSMVDTTMAASSTSRALL